MVREVLMDWIAFLGGKPHQVIFAVSPCLNPPPIYEALRLEGLIDRVIYLDPKGRSIYEADAEGIRLTMEAAETEWVLMVKLDTLPFRSGHDHWLDEAMQAIRDHGCLGLTGSAGRSYRDAKFLVQGYSRTQKFSNNFSILRRDDWLRIQDAEVGKALESQSSGATRNPQFSGDDLRFANEAAVEAFLEAHGQSMLLKWESMSWSVFHVNVWEEQLGRVRDRFRQRQRIAPFLFEGKPARPEYEWEMYYGWPKPSWHKRIRIWVGKYRQRLFQRVESS
jgi:hypothetical protein